ncbi:hypothetical protein GCM10007285_08410 [Stappia taiwanensis]|nr:hypothetical protein GCM10007285_08410 [Stappia taiwanensis]
MGTVLPAESVAAAAGKDKPQTMAAGSAADNLGTRPGQARAAERKKGVATATPFSEANAET